MAKIFECDRIVEAWFAAATHLLACQNRTAFNLILEVHRPQLIEGTDNGILKQVDSAIRAGSNGKLTLPTVIGTIFPQALYKAYGRQDMYEKYRSMLARGRKPHSWGTYADRMMTRQGKDGMSIINPLNIIVEKLKANASPGHNPYKSAYELGIADPEADLLPWPHIKDIGGDIPTYNAAFDANQMRGLPCLSHVSFKLVDREHVNMVAVYRSHHYCARALGNLLGLSNLLNFVATEAGLSVGILTCISTHAELDVASWGGLKTAKAILA